MEILVSRASQNRAIAAAAVLALIAVSANALDNEADEWAVIRSPECFALDQADLAANAAVALHKQADWGKVLNAAKALVAKYSSSGVAHAKLDDVYEAIGSSDDALEAYRRAVKLNPDQQLAWRSLALIYKEKGKATQADFAFSQAIAFQQKTVERQRSEGSKSPIGNMPPCTLGDIYHSAGKDEAAKGCFLQAMQEDPKGIAALMCQWPLQDVYLSEGNEKAAFDHKGTLAGGGTVYGNVTNYSGKVSPGDPLGVPGVLTVSNSYTQTPSATLAIQIGGADPGQVSVLNVLGNANLNGALDPELVNGFVPDVGQSFTILGYASVTGSFSHIQNQVFDNGRKRWSLVYQPTGAVLTVIRNGRNQDSRMQTKNPASRALVTSVLDYVTRRFDESSAGLKSSWGRTFAGKPLNAIAPIQQSTNMKANHKTFASLQNLSSLNRLSI